MREDYWGGDLGVGEKKAVRQQLFKGNDYWFWMGTEVEQAKVSVHVYDADGKLCEQPDSWQKGISPPRTSDPEINRELFCHRGGGELAGRADPLGAGLRVSVDRHAVTTPRHRQSGLTLFRPKPYPRG